MGDGGGDTRSLHPRLENLTRNVLASRVTRGDDRDGLGALALRGCRKRLEDRGTTTVELVDVRARAVSDTASCGDDHRELAVDGLVEGRVSDNRRSENADLHCGVRQELSGALLTVLLSLENALDQLEGVTADTAKLLVDELDCSVRGRLVLGEGWRPALLVSEADLHGREGRVCGPCLATGVLHAQVDSSLIDSISSRLGC